VSGPSQPPILFALLGRSDADGAPTWYAGMILRADQRSNQQTKPQGAQVSRVTSRRRLLGAAIALTAFTAAGTEGRAQVWPAKPIRVIVPLTAGSATDVMARLVMDQVSARLGQPIIVENRPGAGNTIGMSAVAKAEPDGHTILANSSTHTVTPATRSNLGFEMTDLAAIVPLGNMPVVMVVNPAKGYKTLTDFVVAARAKPGMVNYASAGAGNSSHLNGERFRLAAGFEAVHLPFKGAPEALTEVVAGRADFYFAPLINALPLLKDGQLQALAVSGTARASALPDVRTTVEAGYPNSEYNFWAGVFAPAKTPADIRRRLYAEIATALQHPAIRQKLTDLGADPMPLTSEQFEALVRREIETNTQLAKAASIKVN
jgi:tripartite-type tricarboxylate transporter receptor subunit TctC